MALEGASAQDEDPDTDDERAEFVGAGALDRLALAFGATTSLPIAFAIANYFLSRDSSNSTSSSAAASGNVLMLPIAANVQEGGWKFAYAALWALCQVVEAGKDSPNANEMQQQVSLVGLVEG